MRVLVPFRGKKIYTGIVISLHGDSPEGVAPKEILSVLDDTEILPNAQMDFWIWFSGYYMCNLGEVYRMVLPSSLKLESETYIKLKTGKEIDFAILDSYETYLIRALEVRSSASLREVEAFIPRKEVVKTINGLIDLEYIEIDEKVYEKYKPKEITYVRLKQGIFENNALSPIFEKLKKAPKQKELFLHILSLYSENPADPLAQSEVLEKGTFGHSHLKALIEKGIIESYVLEKDRLVYYKGHLEEKESLTDLQIQAKKQIDQAFLSGKNVLLHGVTGSGKTHVYFSKIEETLSRGETVLILLPEVSLVSNFIQRLEKKYGVQLGYYHQGLTDFERVEVWKKIKKNRFRLIIGTRIALFLPYTELGLIVVDEEHDYQYRPKEYRPYYNAKDAAIYLAEIYGAKVILSSATPSLESYYSCMSGKLSHVYLSERYNGVSLPKIELQSLVYASENKKMHGNFSEMLVRDMQKTLEEKKQIMILHNKRGYASVVECVSCGHVTYCPNCDVVMTFHKYKQEMKCHYCGHKAAKPVKCPKCHSERLSEKGVGVEQIYDEIVALFPMAEVERMDADTMRAKFSYEKLYEKLATKKTDILVGTQMITKGLDFDSIELVAVPKVDQMLYVQDFRAEEKLFQLLTQLAGRAGRTSGRGRMILQTYKVEHHLFRFMCSDKYKEVYKYFLEERKKFLYPPFTKLILLEIKHRKEDKTYRAASFLGSVLRKYLPEKCILGPEKSPIPRLNTYYQYQILLKFPKGKKYFVYKEKLYHVLNEFSEIKAYQSIKKFVYVDF
ncbi:MAG: primosomal protein N' [Bergeyella sp.]|nr:primosomal protein N' [Bergeyella sp.]